MAKRLVRAKRKIKAAGIPFGSHRLICSPIVSPRSSRSST